MSDPHDEAHEALWKLVTKPDADGTAPTTAQIVTRIIAAGYRTQAARIAELEALISRDLNAELVDQQQAMNEQIAELEAEVARLRDTGAIKYTAIRDARRDAEGQTQVLREALRLRRRKAALATPPDSDLRAKIKEVIASIDRNLQEFPPDTIRALLAVRADLAALQAEEGK